MSEERACILVVDDEPVNRRLLQAILSAEGYRVVQASRGEDALTLIDAGGVDLVLLDVMMPGPDGIEVCARIRENHGHMFMPVILVTALSDQDSRTRGKAAGADDFLTKPIVEAELVARVRNLLLLRSCFRRSEAERARAEAAARRWKLVSEVARAVATCRDHESLLRSVRESLRQDVPVDAAGYIEAHEGGDELASTFLGRRVLVLAPGQHPDGSFTPYAPFARMLATSSALAASVASTGPASEIAMPMFIGGGLQGVLLLARAVPFSPEEVGLLDDLAPHITNALANVRSHIKAIELIQAKERLSMLLVHDLKNPLSVVKMNLDMLEDHSIPESERAESLADARTAADRLLAMIVDLLDIALAEEGRLPVERKLLDLDGFVAEVLAPYAAIARTQGATFTLPAAVGLRASLDPKLIRRVLENLLNNAFRYVSARGLVEVVVAREGDRVLLRVRNDGPPIPSEVQRNLFDKYGVVNASQGHMNRGLGLYLCRLVVEGHGGAIAVNDRAGGGVSFEVRLPLA